MDEEEHAEWLLAGWLRHPGERRQAFSAAVKALIAAHNDPSNGAREMENVFGIRAKLACDMTAFGVREQAAEGAVESLLGRSVAYTLGLDISDSGGSDETDEDEEDELDAEGLETSVKGAGRL